MRRGGVLLHITSLPSPGPVGDLGPAARRFVDWLDRAGCRSWQLLPLNPTDDSGSPYASPSALAAEPDLLSIEDLVADGWLDPVSGGRSDRVDRDALLRWKRPLLRQAATRLVERDPGGLAAWLEAHPWGSDWGLFEALREHHGGGWWSWPEPLRHRDPAALDAAREEHHDAVLRACALQLLVDRQISRLRRHAASKGIQLIGDVPIFVSGAGCDTWMDPEAFLLDDDGRPAVQAGVPPDYFAEDGQLWGNPLYDWEAQARSGFAWWVARLDRVLEHVDRVRIDHFRGFAAAWAVPRGARTAREGEWTPGPGMALFEALGPRPLIAEDLGVIDEQVEALRDDAGLPGMRILQFAFGDGADHPFLPHNHERNCVVYTGTHDNETSRGWYEAAPEVVQHRFRVYARCDGSDAPWDLIRLAWASVADDALTPAQDLLGLDNSARMNVPGTVQGNWGWRLDQDLPEHIADRLRRLGESFGRT